MIKIHKLLLIKSTLKNFSMILDRVCEQSFNSLPVMKKLFLHWILNVANRF